MKFINYVYLYMHTGSIKIGTLKYQNSSACSNNIMGVSENHWAYSPLILFLTQITKCNTSMIESTENWFQFDAIRFDFK